MPKVDLREKLDKGKIEKPKNEKSKKITLYKKSPLNKLESKGAKSEPLKKEKIDYNEMDKKLLEEEVIRQNAAAEDEKKQETRKKVITALLIVGCIYLCFLIFGVINTQYVYDDTGKVVAHKMTIEQIEEMDHFTTFASQYRQARSLYEQVLVLDYRMGAGEEDPLVIAPDYEKLLESVNELSIQVSAVNLPAEYTQTLNMLTLWIQNDIAIYCQSMSKAISQNDADSAATALQYRTMMYNDFSTITQNTIIIGKQITLADITDIIQWSPESYIQNEIGGIVNYE